MHWGAGHGACQVLQRPQLPTADHSHQVVPIAIITTGVRHPIVPISFLTGLVSTSCSTSHWPRRRAQLPQATVSVVFNPNPMAHLSRFQRTPPSPLNPTNMAPSRLRRLRTRRELRTISLHQRAGCPPLSSLTRLSSTQLRAQRHKMGSLRRALSSELVQLQLQLQTLSPRNSDS